MSLMAQLWSSFIDMVHLLLQFIRSIREGNWKLHLDCIASMLPWMFAHDRTHYSRYLPAYWAEMKQLSVDQPNAHCDLMAGDFSVQRNQDTGFSRVAVDQSIEQTVNRHTKTSGGIIGFSLRSGTVQRDS